MTAPAERTRAALIPLFLIALGVVGIENALTRYFAVAKWSEYGYWIISIVLAGFALSGVVVALLRDTVQRHGVLLRAILPGAMTLAAALGYQWVTQNPFNPLQLQNPTTWPDQVRNIGMYYAALLPFFFLAGLYISLIFVLNPREIGRVYGYDLIGAGVGSAVALGLMFVVHPFLLAPVLLIPLAMSVLFQPGRLSWLGGGLAGAALVAGEAILFLGAPPAFSEFKAIYAPLNTPGAVVVAEIRQPRGHYLLLDDFTERVDADVSNNAGMMGVAGPPKTYGLYRDGNRIASLPMAGPLDAAYAPSALSAAPYVIRPGADVLLVGLSGGYRVAEALTLGAARVDGVESEPVLRDALVRGLGPSPALARDPRVRLLEGGPINAAWRAGRGSYDIVDVSADFVDAAPANVTGVTVEAMEAYLAALKPGGAVSISVSIRDFPVYALRVLATAREALRGQGVADPSAHVMVYRSAWNARILISPTPWSAADIAALQAFCAARSFDVSWHPGLDVTAARARLFNDLPSVSFESGEMTSNGPDDAIANEVAAVLAGRASPSSEAFHIRPATLDRPAFYSSLMLEHPGTLIRRLEVLPQAEIGALVNLAVLAQAIVIALLVLATPALFRRRAGGVKEPRRLWPALYFPALGLGFLFIEILLIDRAAFYLNDYSSAFAIVLTSMLIFSGLGSMIAGRCARMPKAASAIALIVVLAWIGAMLMGAEDFMMRTLDQSWAVRAGLVALAAAPVSLALGLPFPLGLIQVGDGRALPWAWGLNGAFSVVATPLANLMSRDIGFSSLLIVAAGLYALAFLVLPVAATRARTVPLFEPALPQDPFAGLPEPAPARLDPFPDTDRPPPVSQSQTSPA
ncbi:hypothetical protein [Brevundimonas subvibrioides]|uniref:Spermidine synthase n=1 Tax=Brevundimonas subvibrioides (strain ATCC 15264 / DSM 4735 / LMG 14903 / NBRC 16000 / CB 81) TaxID=633149 RepID=D9QNU2_BRESC|nr:hypothetical protein [Brevundimonas subvibrioides]ADL00375.1 conserved hypothetical protein [Brevundimonas subvibrioides ATCC 15264]